MNTYSQPCVRYACHLCTLAKRINVEGGKWKVANLIVLPFSQIVISQPLLNKIKWNKINCI